MLHDFRIIDETDPSPSTALRRCRRCDVTWAPRTFPDAKLLPACIHPAVDHAVDAVDTLNDVLASVRAAGWEREPSVGGVEFLIMGWSFRPHNPTGTYFTDAWRDGGRRRLRIAITDRLAHEQMADASILEWARR